MSNPMEEYMRPLSSEEVVDVRAQKKRNASARAKTDEILARHATAGPVKSLKEAFGKGLGAAMERDAERLHGKEGLMSD